MKQYIPWVISLICCVLVFVCMMKISSLQDQLHVMEGSLNAQINTLQSNINSIYNNVDNRLEAQNNLLSASDYRFENAVPAKGTVDVVCTVTPKIFQPEGTTAVILCNGKEYPMTLQEKQFVATIPLSIYETSDVSSVSFQKDGTIQTQALDWYLNPRDLFLPTMHTRFHGSSRGSVEGANTYVWSPEGKLTVDVEQKGGLSYTIEHIDLVQYIDGKEVDREELYGKRDENSSYFGGTSAEVTSEDPFQMDMEFDKDFELPFGSTMELCVEMDDGSGVIYRNLLERVIVTADGKLDNSEIGLWHGAGANIYDEDGKLLYGTDWTANTAEWQYN